MYTDDLRSELRRNYFEVVAALQALMLQCIDEADTAESPRVLEYLKYGAGRRVSVLWHAIQNVFRLFPLNTVKPLPNDDLVEAQINLHAFVVNVWGVFDNFAWAFIFRHNLESRFKDRRKVGLFKAEIKQLLPPELSAYLSTPKMREWHEQYLTNFRDALAHRIPLYIPPAIWSRDEGERYRQLDGSIRKAILSRDFDDVDALRKEQDSLGKPCGYFLHSFTDDITKTAVELHPQMIADSLTIIEFGKLYFRHWQELTQRK